MLERLSQMDAANIYWGPTCARQAPRELAFLWKTQKDEWVSMVRAEPQGTWEQLQGLPTLPWEVAGSPLEEGRSKLTRVGQVNQVCRGDLKEQSNSSNILRGDSEARAGMLKWLENQSFKVGRHDQISSFQKLWVQYLKEARLEVGRPGRRLWGNPGRRWWIVLVSEKFPFTIKLSNKHSVFFSLIRVLEFL